MGELTFHLAHKLGLFLITTAAQPTLLKKHVDESQMNRDPITQSETKSLGGVRVWEMG